MKPSCDSPFTDMACFVEGNNAKRDSYKRMPCIVTQENGRELVGRISTDGDINVHANSQFSSPSDHTVSFVSMLADDVVSSMTSSNVMLASSKSVNGSTESATNVGGGLLSHFKSPLLQSILGKMKVGSQNGLGLDHSMSTPNLACVSSADQFAGGDGGPKHRSTTDVMSSSISYFPATCRVDTKREAPSKSDDEDVYVCTTEAAWPLGSSVLQASNWSAVGDAVEVIDVGSDLFLDTAEHMATAHSTITAPNSSVVAASISTPISTIAAPIGPAPISSMDTYPISSSDSAPISSAEFAHISTDFTPISTDFVPIFSVDFAQIASTDFAQIASADFDPISCTDYPQMSSEDLPPIIYKASTPISSAPISSIITPITSIATSITSTIAAPISSTIFTPIFSAITAPISTIPAVTSSSDTTPSSPVLTLQHVPSHFRTDFMLAPTYCEHVLLNGHAHTSSVSDPGLKGSM